MEVQDALSRSLVTGEVLARNARNFPDRLAVIDGKRRISYSIFNQRVNSLANSLREMGVGRGDRVATMLFNSLEIAECYFAAAKLGAVVVPIHTRLAPPEILYIVNHCGARVMVFDGRFINHINRVRAEMVSVRRYVVVEPMTPGEDSEYEELIAKSPPVEPGIAVDDDDPAFILYTAGTTGHPKGAVLTHKNFLVSILNTALETGLGTRDTFLCVVPVYHASGLVALLMQVYLGGTVVMVREFDPAVVARVMSQEGVTSIFLVPAMWRFLLQFPGLAGQDTTTLKVAFSGGALLPVKVKQRLLEVFPQCRLFELFGQTEVTAFTCVLKPGDVLDKAPSVGRPLIHLEVRVVDEQAQDVPVGSVGEVVYRGPTVMQGYYRDPEATAQAFRDGWFHSGDLARVDDAGFLYLVDRKKDMVVTGGEKVYPAEVEEVLAHHPKVLEAAVIGIPSSRWGEAVHAVVVPRPGAKVTAEEIMEFCAESLAGFKQPKSVEFAAALPRNAAGKILKTQLREKFREPTL